VPAVTFNETHVAVVCPTGAGVRVSVHRVGEFGAVEERAERTVRFAFPDDFGDGNGLLCAHMGPDGAIAVGFGSGVVLLKNAERSLSSIRIDGPAIVTAVGLDERGLLALGTSSGICFGVDTETLEARWMECVPAVEPVVGVRTSNGRVLMQTMTGVCGRLMPAVPAAGLMFLPMPRPLCAAVCGTMLYILDKYGPVQLLSTVMRHVAFPFKGPLQGGAPSAQYHYAAVHAAPERVVCLYPTGLVRILELAK